jgi:hypothetical protein
LQPKQDAVEYSRYIGIGGDDHRGSQGLPGVDELAGEPRHDPDTDDRDRNEDERPDLLHTHGEAPDTLHRLRRDVRVLPHGDRHIAVELGIEHRLKRAAVQIKEDAANDRDDRQRNDEVAVLPAAEDRTGRVEDVDEVFPDSYARSGGRCCGRSHVSPSFTFCGDDRRTMTARA